MTTVIEAAVPTRQPYDGFDKLPIGGVWKHGSSAKRAADLDPYTGDTLVEIPLASRADVDAAYAAAAAAQPAWEATPPAVKQQVLFAAARIFQERREEIIDWLAREAGSAVIKASFEWQTALADITQAAAFPYQVLV